MRFIAVSFLLATLALASCRRSEGVTNINSAAHAANGIEETSPNRTNPHESCVNVNTATSEELTRLPGVGDITARKIVVYRDRHGRFRRPEEIIIIEGFSERKYRAIADLVCVE